MAILSHEQQQHQQQQQQHHSVKIIGAEITDPFNLTEAVIVGAVASLVFFYLNVYCREKYSKPLKNDEYGARVISLIHSLVSTVGCCYALLQHPTGWFDTVASTRLEADMAMVSFAYFLVDSAVMVLWKFDLVYFLHHIVTCSFCGYTAFLGKYGFLVAFSLFGGEFTNPMMHYRWLLHANNPVEARAGGWLMKCLTGTWFVSFFLFRFFAAPYVAMYVVLEMPFFLAPPCIGIMVMSWKFLVDAARMEWKGEWWTG